MKAKDVSRRLFVVGATSFATLFGSCVFAPCDRTAASRDGIVLPPWSYVVLTLVRSSDGSTTSR